MFFVAWCYYYLDSNTQKEKKGFGISSTGLMADHQCHDNTVDADDS